MLLNIDLGELPDEPDELYQLASWANVACGGHAGDDASMARAVALAALHGTRVAAHPSYPDRPRFGRVSMALPPGALAATVAEQCASLRAAAARHDPTRPVTALKPHGALYHDANARPDVAAAVIDGACRGLALTPDTLTVVGPPRGALRDEATRRGATHLREGFADRGLAPDGSLLPRGTPGALVVDPARAAAQALALAASHAFDSLCIHGDSPHALAVARAVRAALDALPAVGTTR